MDSVKKIKVSYLVASYNHEKYILNCLDSIKKNLTEHDEVIIIDDGSTDKSREIINSWVKENQDKMAIQFFSQKNSGISRTLNRLFSLARGQYYRTVSSDDAIVAGSTNLLLDALDKDRETLVAFGDAILIDNGGSEISTSNMDFFKKNRDMYRQDIKRALITRWCVCGPSWLLRSSITAEIGFFDESLLVEDWNMYLRLASADKIVFCDSAVAFYRVHGGNVSRTTDIERKISNLQSQILAGEKNLRGFNYEYRLLLEAEISKLACKVYYLRKKMLKAIMKYSEYVILHWYAVTCIKLKLKR